MKPQIQLISDRIERALRWHRPIYMTVKRQRIRILDCLLVNTRKHRFEFLTEVGIRYVKFNRALDEIFLLQRDFEKIES